mmetsp:Transcript_94873/g.267866  ORF Transcript_94873/g.267866 Transcript_94873/m.267866 type:complete len:258 (+) Transcript_94873:199-972(+)
MIDRLQADWTSDTYLIKAVGGKSSSGARPSEALTPNIAAAVRAAEAEGGDTPDDAAQSNVSSLRLEIRGEARHVEVGIELPQMAVWRATRRPEHDEALHEACYTSSRFQVADVALRARLHKRRPSRPEHSAQRSHLDRVAERGARAVALRDGYVVRRQTRLPQRRQDARRLRGPIRGCQRRTFAVLVDARAHQAQGLRVWRRLDFADSDVDSPATFPAFVAIAALVESEATPFLGEHRGPRKHDVEVRTDDGADAHG